MSVQVGLFVGRDRADNGGPPYGRVASRRAVICMRPADVSAGAARSFLSSSRRRFLEATDIGKRTTTLSAVRNEGVFGGKWPVVRIGSSLEHVQDERTRAPLDSRITGINAGSPGAMSCEPRIGSLQIA